MKVLHLCLTLIFFHVSGTNAFQWTSTGSLPNGKVIPACPGQDVTLAWSYSAKPEEHLNNVVWHYTPSGGSETVLATHVMGVFFAAPGSPQNVQFIANVGIRLQHVATADAGTYSVHVNLNLTGKIVRQVQTVQVQVSDQGVTTDGQLHVEMLADAVYDNSTQQFHVQLACGHFLPVWSARARVVWKTPSGQSLPSTAYDNGRFLLSVPNPVVSGEYTCVIEKTPSASLCVGSGSPLHRGVTVNVDGVQARFALMDARIKSEEQKNKALQTHVDNLQTQLTSNQHQLETLSSKILTAARSVSFHARRTTSDQTLNAGDTLIFNYVYSNEGGAYSATTGVFTVPVDGTYAFFVTASTAETSGTKHTIVYVAVDSAANCYAHSTFESGQWESNSCSVVLVLRAGQRVDVRSYNSNSRYNTEAYFSGALLHAAMP